MQYSKVPLIRDAYDKGCSVPKIRVPLIRDENICKYEPMIRDGSSYCVILTVKGIPYQRHFAVFLYFDIENNLL